jgi:ABC-type multidrug transport system permease subunit
MSEQEYLEQRLDHQICWYNNKSIKYQKRYIFYKMLEMFFATSIPVIASTIPNAIVISILGGGIAFMTERIKIC